MPASNIVQVKVSGLQTNNSELSEVDPGSLNDCNNVVLNRDSIIEPRRGFKLYGNAMGVSETNDKAKQLFSYKDRLLRHFSNTLQFDDGSGNFVSFNGSYSELASGIKMKGKEVNGNFYFTTSEGIKKLSAKTASDLGSYAGYVTQAGGIKALDVQASVNPQLGFFEQNSKVGYRVVWGIKDLNGNLILGSPSQRIVVENSQLTLMIKDFNALLAKLDTEASTSGGDELSDVNYVSLYKMNVTSGTATTLKTNLIGLANKLEEDVNLIADSAYSRTTSSASVTSNVATITFSSAIPSWVAIGQTVRISGFTAPAATVLNGDRLITAVGASTVSFGITTPDFGPTADVGAKVINHDFNAITQPGTVENPATTTMLDDLQNYYDLIIEAIVALDTSQIANASSFSTNFSTQSSTVDLTFAIPLEITTSNFFQIYRTAVAVADGPVLLDDIDPGDEMGLVYEANPTSAQITARQVTVQDVTPESFRGANLYTNPQSGEGILQANERPPIALDINVFKGSTFYANTQTLQRLTFSMLGISNLVSGVSTFIVTNGSVTQTYTFTSPVAEQTTITTVADVAGSLAGTYFLLNSAENATEYYVWFKVSGVGTDPAISGKTGIQVDILNNDADTAVATALRNKLNQYSDFVITGATNQAIITNVAAGVTTNSSDFDTGFTVTTSINGDGEDASTNKVLLSAKPTPAQQVEETALSLARVINKNLTSPVNAYYLSGVNDVPGQILFENRSLSDGQFYLGCNDSATTGASFSPALPQAKSVTNISVANPTVLTSTSHGLTTGQQIVIYASNSTPVVNGVRTVTNIGVNTFSVPVNVVSSGSSAMYFLTTVTSDNEVFPNRIYFSKFQQPEAVPIVNYMDVGPKDIAILRIIPLRDSLFVLKEDAIYRISGESVVTGFSLALFDSSTALLAADSAEVLNNQVYMFSDQGIVAVSDTGVSVISRKIENQLLTIINSTNFASNTWGVSYENDRAYLLGTITTDEDTVSTVIFRYNVFTDSWTKWKISKTCGLVKSQMLYFGAGDTNFIEQERKDFSRTDYADREHAKTLNTGSVSGTSISINNINNVSVNDVIYQQQYLTIYKFNQLLLKLDNDSGVADTNYYSLLAAVAGVSLRDRLTSLALKLDSDAGISDSTHSAAIAAYTSSFVDTQAAFNILIGKLNANANVVYSNYPLSSGTVEYEAIIESVNTNTAIIKTQTEMPLIAGPTIVYNHIPKEVTFNVQTFGDSELYKQVSEAKFIFERTNFTKATISYISDISEAYEETEFTQYGNGIFGNYAFGNNPFGGGGDKSPLRTYVPRSKQRCRFLTARVSHNIAREKMGLLGYSMVARAYGSKAYR